MNSGRNFLNGKSLMALLMVMLSVHFISAQNIQWHVKIFSTRADTLIIDSLTLFPGAQSESNFNYFIVKSKEGDTITNHHFKLDIDQSTLIWIDKPSTDSVTVSYVLLPYNLSKNYFHKDYQSINRSDSIRNQPYVFSLNNDGNTTLFNGTGMNYNGGFSRGISFGNNQDVIVNSNFNLQLKGRMAGDVDVVANLSDNNIPIQPDGTTQQLQEFDKVFIQLKRKNTTLTVGDYEMHKPDSYFLGFNKKVQGIEINNSFKVNHSITGTTWLSASVAKGKYAINHFNGVEGNQGPYRLTGSNNETFIIVLSGTEKVYVDGKLLQRGETADYIIDYNSGQITFTPYKIITKDSRVVVEFEYSDKNYFRSTYFIDQNISSQKWNVGFELYSETDNKNQPIRQPLDSMKEAILIQAGDSSALAYYNAVDSVSFSSNRILYAKKDSVPFGEIYVYSTDENQAHYALTFSYMGEQKGNYVIASTVANGRVYTWVAPVAGVKQGNYEPIINLVAPQSQKQFVINAAFHPVKDATVSFETSITNFDLNTFSALNDADNNSAAQHFAVAKDFTINKSETNPLKLSVGISDEIVAANFHPVEPYRNVEFNRDWNLNETTFSAQNYFEFSTALSNKKNGNLEYHVSRFQMENLFTGWQHQVIGQWNVGGFKFNSHSSFTRSQTDSSEIDFIRPTISVLKSFKKLNGISVTAGFDGEKNNGHLFSTDSLINNSFYWQQWNAGVMSSDTSRFGWNLTVSNRMDFAPVKNQFTETSQAKTISSNVLLRNLKAQQLNVIFTYRQLQISDTSLSLQKPDENILGTLNYQLNLWKGTLNTGVNYTLASGQELKKEFTYVEVAAGQGNYTWTDYNNDSIPQVTEFEPAAFQDQANYIKVISPTNEYIHDYENEFGFNLSVTPRAIWYNSDGIKKFLARLSTQSSLQTTKKTLPGTFGTQFNPVQTQLSDSILISATTSSSNFFYFNRTNQVWGFDFGQTMATSKTLLTSGFESRIFKTQSLKLRWNISKSVSINSKVEWTDKLNNSEFLVSQQYDVKGKSFNPQLILQPGKSMRFSADYLFSDFKNQFADANDHSVINHLGTEYKYNVVSKSTLTAQYTFAYVNFSGVSNTPAQFAMLNGLKPGANSLWNVSYQRHLSNVIEVTFIYEGRKTGTSKMVHTGRAQVSATF